MIYQTKSCRIRSESNPQNWRTERTTFRELQKWQNSKAGKALDKILFRIWYLCWNLTFILARQVTFRNKIPTVGCPTASHVNNELRRWGGSKLPAVKPCG